MNLKILTITLLTMFCINNIGYGNSGFKNFLIYTTIFSGSVAGSIYGFLTIIDEFDEEPLTKFLLNCLSGVSFLYVCAPECYKSIKKIFSCNNEKQLPTDKNSNMSRKLYFLHTLKTICGLYAAAHSGKLSYECIRDGDFATLLITSGICIVSAKVTYESGKIIINNTAIN